MTEVKNTKNRTILWVFLAFTLGFILPVGSCLGTSLLAMTLLGRVAGDAQIPTGTGADAVAVIELNGVITNDPSQRVVSPQGVIASEDVAELLDQAAELPNVKAVVVRINSPGGSVVVSDEIYHMFLDFEKPIVIWMADTAASGGYYIACGGDHVVAHPDTLTGSIGVISQFINAQELLEEVGVDVVVLTSGSYKDMGSLFRDMTEEERQVWENILDQIHADFVRVVAESRDLSEDQVSDLADGRIYTGQQAFEHGLVDEVGLPTDAIARAAELGGIEGEPEVIDLNLTPSFFESLSGLQATSSLPTWQEILSWAGTPSVEFRFIGP